MGTRHPRPLSPLQQPSATVVRGHAERLAQEADVAIRRLGDHNDVQALHDSRVALRRLRGWLRAFESELQVKSKRRKALKRLAHSTNRARDAEVSLEWLNVLERTLNPKALAGLKRFTSELTRIRDADYRRLRRVLPRDWRRLVRKLRRAASCAGDKGKSRPFQKSFMVSLRAYSLDFEKALVRARRAPTPRKLHTLRIAGKRLRYLVETLLPWYPRAGGFMREMRLLHDTTGAVQDLQRLIDLSEHAFLRQAGSRYRRLLAEYLDSGADHRTLPRPDFAPGLAPQLWICRRAGQVQTEYVQRIKKDFLGRRTPACLRELRLITRDLGRPMTVR